MDKLIDAAKTGANQYQKDQLSLLKRLCNIDSGTTNIKGNEKIVAILDQTLTKLGAEVTHIEAPGYGKHIVARIPSNQSEGKVILAAHLDTVFEEGNALKHPFRIEDDYAYGLGAADCKGGVVTAIYAIKILIEANLLPDKDLVLVLNCDEEVGSPSGQKLFEQEARDADYVLSFEPGRKRNGVLTSRYGVLEGKIKIQGESAHACMDGGPGANAVLELAHLIVELDKKDDSSLGIHYNVSPIHGGTGPSVVADYAEAEFWVTVASQEAYEQVKQEVLEELPKAGKVDGCDISTTIDLKFPPMERCESNIQLYEKVQTIGAQMGIDLPEEMSKSPADCNFYSALGVPVIDGLGPYMHNIHTVNEHILISSLPKRTQLVAVLLSSI